MTPEIPIERFEVFATGLDHPECVAFDRDGALWAGGEAGQVYRIDRSARVGTIATLGGFTGGIAFSPEDELFVCNPSLGVVRVLRNGRHELFASHAAGHRIVTPNYAVFDSAGNLFITDSGNWKKQNGYLLRFEKDGTGAIFSGPFGYANGLCLSDDGKTLLMVESDTNSVLKIDPKTGASELFARDAGRLPDGLAFDVSGNAYVSSYASDDIHRLTPAGEKSLFAYDPFAILLSRPTNMAFDGEWMYVANLGRTTVTRAKVGVLGQKLVNQR